MLLRLAATLDVGSAFIYHSTKEKLYADALKNANSRMAITSAETLLDNSRLIITEGSLIGLDELRQLLELPGRIIFIENAPATRADEIFESLDEGLMLNGKRDILIISRPHMQKVRYSI